MARRAESGSVIFFILVAVVLIGLVTVALRGSGLESASIDREALSITVSQVRGYGDELERAVTYILQDGISENDISFAWDDASAPSEYGTYDTTPRAEVFHPRGGGAIVRNPPARISSASHWEFYGHTAAPDVGSSKADLIAVLPDVSAEFCTKINQMNGHGGQPEDTSDCVNGTAGERFQGNFSGTPNVIETGFSRTPATEACVECSGVYHYYRVLMAR